MSNKIFKFLILLVTGYALLVTISSAEEIDPNAVISQRQQLEAQLQQLEAQINSYSTVIQEKQKQATTLERDIAIFDAQIEKAKLEIKMRTIQISELSGSINDKSETIQSLSDKIEQERESLAELLRKTQEIDSNSLLEVFLSQSDWSDFFQETDFFDSLQNSIHGSLDEMRGTKQQTEDEKTDLENQKAEQTQLMGIQQMEKNIDLAREEPAAGFEKPVKIIKYCRNCELTCPVGK